MPPGIYISVPFCKSKCSYCNFASGVFSADRMQRYVERVCADITGAGRTAERLGAKFEKTVDSIYLGGGTPSILDPAQLQALFKTVREHFDVGHDAEVTVECVPGTLSEKVVAALVDGSVNRVSLGVQSFVDQEARSVGRLHTRKTTLSDIESLRAAGINDINIDLIAGLPFQAAASWEESLKHAIDTGVQHISVYMLEVDDDSRLGRELMAGGVRYHAHHVPNADLIVECYERACEILDAAGIKQYEISNFARPGSASHHNLKYWTRQPYFGFGLDAHSMLWTEDSAVRFAPTDDLDTYLSETPTSYQVTTVSRVEALEEEFFLGLRLNEGIDLREIERRVGRRVPAEYLETIEELLREGLLLRKNGRVALTGKGRLLSNEVFERFISTAAVVA